MDATSLFLQRAPLDVVFAQLPKPFDQRAQQHFFTAAIEPYHAKYPPPLRYLKSFLKRVLKLLEQEGLDLELIDEFAELAVETSVKDFSSTDDTEGSGYLVFQVNYPDNYDSALQLDVVSRQQQHQYQYQQEQCTSDCNNQKRVKNVLIRRNNYHNQVGMKLWKAGLLMADFSINMSHLFRGRKVLELGSGTGVTGITLAAVCQPSTIYMTDFHDEVLRNLEYNANINIDNSVSEVVVSHLDWSTCSESDIRKLDSDILVAADCTYSMDLCVIVLQTISSFLRYDNVSFSTSAAVSGYEQWRRVALDTDKSTPPILFTSRKICFLCFTIRAPETLEFFFNTLQSLREEITYTDVTEWVLQSCSTNSFFYEGGKEDLRVLCVVPAQ
jgi:predicted nicotinamide N-methyase